MIGKKVLFRHYSGPRETVLNLEGVVLDKYRSSSIKYSWENDKYGYQRDSDNTTKIPVSVNEDCYLINVEDRDRLHHVPCKNVEKIL